MNRTIYLTLLSTLFVSASLAFADGDKPICGPVIAPQPGVPIPAELEQLDALVGKYRCTGQTFELPGGLQSAHPLKASLHFERDLGQLWFQGRYAEELTAQNPVPHGNLLFFTYDATAHLFRRTVFGPGTAEGRYTSPGVNAEGQSLWSGEIYIQGIHVPMRELMDTSNRKVSFKAELSLDGGTSWIPGYEIFCSRL